MLRATTDGAALAVLTRSARIRELVYATDALGGSGIASFTWTVTPEATCPEVVWQGGVASIQSEPCSSGARSQ